MQWFACEQCTDEALSVGFQSCRDKRANKGEWHYTEGRLHTWQQISIDVKG